MRPPNAFHQRCEIGIRCDREIRHGSRDRTRFRHLPTRDKNHRRVKRLLRLDFIGEGEGSKKMRAAEWRIDVAHRDGVRQRVVDPTLRIGKAIRPVRGMNRRDLGAGDRGFNPGPLGVKVRFRRIEDRLEHCKRIERVDGE